MTARARRNILRGGVAVAALGVITLLALWLIPPGAGRTAEAGDQATAASDAAAKTDDSDKTEKAPIPVKVAEATTGDIAAYISTTANLVAEADVRVLAEAEGLITDLKVEEGRKVGAGEVLAVLDHSAAEIALNKARLKASNAEMAFSRAEKTLRDGLISSEEFDRVRLEHEVARQEVAEAEWALQKTVIRAPFAGQVTERMITVGQHVRPGDVLFGVASFDPLIARLYLAESDVLHLAEGRAVRISLAADPSLSFRGRIRQISPVVDTATGTVKVTVEAVAPPQTVRPGAFVTVDIERERHPAAVLLPREAVVRELRSAHVFVASDDGTAVKRIVELGLEEGDLIEAIDGVSAGEQVIIAGQGGLKAGTKIKVL
jgi:membrane fusion protein, multidrug efflux system